MSIIAFVYNFAVPEINLVIVRLSMIVYKINCSDCSWSYIGETGRKKEHSKNVEHHKVVLTSPIMLCLTITKLIPRTAKL